MWVAYTFSTDVWVNFKLFGGMGLMLAFVLAQAAWISRHLPDEEHPLSRKVGEVVLDVAELLVGAPGGVDMDARQVQPPLHRPLDPAQALHFLEGHPRGHPPQAAARGDDCSGPLHWVAARQAWLR